MYLGVDDTDSREGMCTTYLMTKIIEESGEDLIGFPSLVRFNPNVPHCTRGNAGLSVRLGIGMGDPVKIGSFGSRPLISFPEGEDSGNQAEVLSKAVELVEKYMEKDPDTNPGIVITQEKLPSTLYELAVKSFVSIEYVEKIISGSSGIYRKLGNGRGIIGAASAIAWPGERATFELISYGFPHRNTDRKTKLSISAMVDSLKTTFDSYDRENRRPAMFPSNRTPIIYGIRGTSWHDLYRTRERISNTTLGEERFLIYKTNQGSDDHIIENPDQLTEGESYKLEGQVVSSPKYIKGGHYFTEISTKLGVVKVAAFEPTKRFRNTFRQLQKGDFVRVFGSFLNNSIHTEKMEIIGLSTIYNRVSPACANCGEKTRSHGLYDYRCPKCGRASSLPDYQNIARSIKTGNYEVPTCARRHISRPLALDFISEAAS